jgi:hypothetical protein
MDLFCSIELILQSGHFGFGIVPKYEIHVVWGMIQNSIQDNGYFPGNGFNGTASTTKT